jgi:hypothetical protein
MHSPFNEYLCHQRSRASACSMDPQRHEKTSYGRLGLYILAVGLMALKPPIAGAQADYCEPNSPGGDETATYCTQPNFPTYGTPTQPLPANQRACQATIWS